MAMMTEFFGRQDEGELVMDMLSGNGKEIAKGDLRDILEEAMGRQIGDKEMGEIMMKVFEADDGDTVSKKKILGLLANARARN